ncbi:MAG: hypothetical protein P8X70_01660 [Nanoarchaeota archaeon]|jgi:hypothetical protein
MNKNKISNSLRGKRSRAAGRRFEAKVRGDLEKLGWIVDKWTNTIDYDKNGKIGKIVPAKRKWNPFKKVMVIGTGFPDFICFRNIEKEETIEGIPLPEKYVNKSNKFEVIGVEVKSVGYLNQKEKGMCFWLLKNRVFSRILIARKRKEGRRIKVEYKEFNKNL